MVDLYFVLTRFCNYSCKHCYVSAGPGMRGDTMSVDDFSRCIDNLPLNRHIDICLTGGEIFADVPRLEGYLGVLREADTSRARGRRARIKYSLQTNAFWARDDDSIRARLSWIKARGVTSMDVPSNDRYHAEQGANRKNLARLVEIADSEFGFYISLRGTTRTQVAPMGRAIEKGFRVSEMQGYSTKSGCRAALDRLHLTVDWRGDVYSCCFQKGKLPGSLVDMPLRDIVVEAKKNKDLVTLTKMHGVRTLAQRQGWEFDDAKEFIADRGACTLCFTLKQPIVPSDARTTDALLLE